MAQQNAKQLGSNTLSLFQHSKIDKVFPAKVLFRLGPNVLLVDITYCIQIAVITVELSVLQLDCKVIFLGLQFPNSRAQNRDYIKNFMMTIQLERFD